MLTIIKIWALSQDTILDQSDIDYCQNNNIKLDLQHPQRQTIEVGGGKVFQFCSLPGFVKLTTFDDSAEVMLQLRYSGKVQLMNQWQNSVNESNLY